MKTIAVSQSGVPTRAIGPIRLPGGMDTVRLRGSIGVLALVLLSGCAGLGKEECLTADWRTIGYEDGLRGYAAERIGGHRAACAKHQVTPDLNAYTEGRERGLQEYCQPRNGFRAGINGRSYENVCPAASEAAFIDGYRYGRQIYEARSELRGTQGRLQSAREGVAQTEKAIENVKAELIQPGVPVKRRLLLVQELQRLGDELRDREAQVHRLSLRSHELHAHVRELEAQSPYAY
jgi:hypothetical protein